MYNVKKQYTRPRPILYLYRDKPEISLVSNDFNTSKNITLNQQMNEVSTLEFEIPFTKERKLSVDDCEKLVKFEKEFYIIKTINTEDSETATMKVSCQHESTELKGVYCQYINLIGASPKEMFDKVMSSTMHPVDTGYKWAGTDVPNDKKRHLITESEQSVYQNLVAIAEVFNGWLEFWTDDDGQKWVYLRVKAIDNKKFIKKGIDMKSLNITYSSEEIFTRLYPTGASDTLTGQPLNIMEVNPTKKSYVENYSYYIAKGIPTEVIDKEAKYQQLKTLNDSDYTDAKDLYNYALEELKKCCYPQLDAELTMQDLSVYVNSLDEPPKVGYEIKCIDKDIDFILVCRITGVERNYENPLETKITISNMIRYNTIFQDLEHSSNTTDKVVGGDSDGSYIPADKVKDGSHINVAYTLNNHTTQITENSDKIELVAKDTAGNTAQLEIQKNQISTLVVDVNNNKSAIKQNADNITATVTRLGEAESKIQQNADNIALKVSKGELGSLIKQEPTAVKVAWNKISKYAEIDDTDGLILCDPSNDSYTQIGYDGRLSLKMNGVEKPYHCLAYQGVARVTCYDDDYTEWTMALPKMFDGIDDDDIKVAVAIKKVYKDGYYLPYWFGAYGSVENGDIVINAMSAWREYSTGKAVYDVDVESKDGWVTDVDASRSNFIESIGSPEGGKIEAQFIVMA